jgi:hypothetical protein
MADTVSITATVLGHEIVSFDEVPWTQGMTALAAMEAALDSNEDPGFAFLVGYHGSNRGYLVHSIKWVGDQPCVYWLFEVNGAAVHSGLDRTELKSGDALSFTYAYYRPAEAGKNPQLEAKFARERLRPTTLSEA